MEASEQSLASSDASSALAASVYRLRRRARSQATPQNILLFLVAFRIVNALSVRTFFQPDEFFQSLEPAWQVAFGRDSGAWITWEWKHELRSSIHPLFFAVVYYIVGSIAWIVQLSSLNSAEFLIAAPKVAQAVIAATGDYFTWKLASKVYGHDSYGAWATLALTALNPWQWFCSTRTFSNCAETTLTVVALYFWPWDWFLDIKDDEKEDDDTTDDADETLESMSRQSRYRWPGLDGDIFTIMFLTVALSSLRKSLLLAALACVLRPTNVIIWVCVAGFAIYNSPRSAFLILLREAALCGSAVLGLSTLIDRLFYGEWAFPVFKFLYINVAQSIAIFYGHNDWHYYLSQGFPLLLTTALPFGIFGVYKSLRLSDTTPRDRRALIKFQLASVCLAMPAVLSIIAHKEVRFIYPLLPALHILAAEPLVSSFLPAITSSSNAYLPQRLILLFLILVNIFVAYYTTLIHGSGPVEVLSYLRERHEAHQDSSGASLVPHPLYEESYRAAHYAAKNMSVGFLMPCHSTPWRSHFVFPSIEAWALSCEPPVGLNETEKKIYLDEADQFYADPAGFLQHHMIGGLWHMRRRPSYMSTLPPRSPPTAYYSHQKAHPLKEPLYHEWPDYLVFFAQLEPTIRTTLRSSSYGECWRTWNTAWHDDWRRRGDIVVWCLDPSEQQEWRKIQHRQQAKRREQHFDRIISRFEKRKKKQKKTGFVYCYYNYYSKIGLAMAILIQQKALHTSPVLANKYLEPEEREL
ncbi:GPI mannosyltransferase 3 [Talaromyces atroroseus]|uniref:Mannosyltransferase n=1 Tax=Talaromyces atroroseus TaxID=1441469 RepID=A0A225A939_TALAT|nr:GPI mannosyltransferase 3 [Talaromyces atroroseus]OKL56510.1 GPI mannosyltransferase 3 [Talaromyces atroroseus]